MGTRFDRKANEAYWTEPWVTEALMDNVRLPSPAWEPACGRGDMAGVLRRRLTKVYVSDIRDYGCEGWQHADFIGGDTNPTFTPHSIITNPPYGKRGILAERFIETALDHTRPIGGMVAMLLRNEFDTAKGRSRFFDTEQAPFTLKLVLTKRPRWDDWDSGKPPAASPYHRFAWYVWDWTRPRLDAALIKHVYLSGSAA